MRKISITLLLLHLLFSIIPWTKNTSSYAYAFIIPCTNKGGINNVTPNLPTVTPTHEGKIVSSPTFSSPSFSSPSFSSLSSPSKSKTALQTYGSTYLGSGRYRPKYQRWNYADINYERPFTTKHFDSPNGKGQRRRWSFDNDFYWNRASYRRPDYFYYGGGGAGGGDYDGCFNDYYEGPGEGGLRRWNMLDNDMYFSRYNYYDSPRRSGRYGGGYTQWPWPEDEYYERRFNGGYGGAYGEHAYGEHAYGGEHGSGVGVGVGGSVYGFGRNPYTAEQNLDTLDFIPVQGDSRRTCSISEYVDRVLVVLQSSGDVCKAEIDVWGGPTREGMKMNVYLEDGYLYPFRALLGTPRQSSNSISIRNIGVLEFPFSAAIEPDRIDDGRFNHRPDVDFGAIERLGRRNIGVPLQGGAVETFPMPPSVSSVQVLLETDGRPLRAKIELLQGPNNSKQVVEVQCDDGREHPLYLIMETPIDSNVIRVENIASMEFPLYASIEPYSESSVYERAKLLGPSTNWM